MSLHEFFTDYARLLGELRNHPDRDTIMVATDIAAENERYCVEICRFLERKVDQARPDYKLPIMYVIDSIAKNVGGRYVPEFSVGIVSLFLSTYRTSPAKAKLSHLLDTWQREKTFSPHIVHAMRDGIRKIEAEADAAAAARRRAPRHDQYYGNGRVVSHDAPLHYDRGVSAGFKRQRTDLHGGYVEHGSYAAPPREYTEPYYSGHSAPPPPAMDYSYPARAPVDSYRDPVPAPYHRSDVHPPRSLLPPPPARSGALLPLPAPARPVVPAYDRSHVGSGGGAGPGDAGDPAMYPRTRVVGRRRARSRSPSPGRTGQPPDVARRGSSGASTVFVMDKLKGAADAIVKQLYNDGPRCTNCGLRFEKANELQDHLSWHFKQNHQKTKNAVSVRWWYGNADEWVAGDQGSRPTGESFVFEEADAASKEEAPTPDVQVVIVDDDVGNCPVCGEEFEKKYDDDMGEFVFLNAVRSDGAVIHATCQASAS